MIGMTSELQVIDLGLMPYAQALEEQQRLHAAVLAEHAAPTVLLVEHPPVITVSKRRGAGEHLLAGADMLRRLGIEVQPTDRGGDITYHGPGQLVSYPILRLAPLRLTPARYMRLLEAAVIETLACFGIAGQREEGATGVWVPPEAMTRDGCHGVASSIQAAGGGMAQNTGSKLPVAPGVQGAGVPAGAHSVMAVPAKICAMGVRIRRNVSMHGIALNVTTRLEHFDTIIPCGLAGRGVTSLQRLLGPDTPSMEQVKAAWVAALRDELARAAGDA